MRLDLSGDIHPYARYWGPPSGASPREDAKAEQPRAENYASVVSGIGGAFHHPSQTYLDEVQEQTLYPRVDDSRAAVALSFGGHNNEAGGAARINGEERRVEGLAFIDDNAGYHARRTIWKWCGGVGTDALGRTAGWNLVIGLNDMPGASENTLWLDGVAQEVGPVTFAPDLSSVTFAEGGTLHFHQEATRERLDNFIIIRSDYAQPIGTFTGTLPGGVELTESYGVMERQDALW